MIGLLADKAAPAALVSNRNSTDQRKQKTFRDLARLRSEMLRLEASKIMRSYDLPGARAVTCCGNKSRAGGSVSLTLNRETGRASFGGLQRCSNVWACPTCSRRIARKRGDEANAALAAARAEGLSVFLLTFTFRHKAGMDLKAMLQSLVKARARFTERREYRALSLVGSITATEVTHGERAGFHPHMHVIVFAKGDAAANLAALKKLGPVWRRCLQSFGLDGGKAAFDCRDGSAAGDYISKGWQAAEELTLGVEKTGKAGGRTPSELLLAASDGCNRSARLWAEYVSAFAGKRQLVWSRGLKGRFKIQEVTDAQAAEDASAAEAQTVVVKTFTAEEWQVVRYRKTAILRACERGGSLERAMLSPPDWELWRRINGDRWER